MKTNRRNMLSGTLITLAGVAAGRVLAQVPPPGGRPNFDPATIQKMLLDNLRNAFEVTEEDEWKLISDRVMKVFEARTQVGSSAAGMARLFRRPGQDDGNNPGGRRGGMFGGAPDPDADALQKAIDSKASNAELKAAITKVVEGRKQKQARLEQAQAALREVLSVRQEAVAISVGLL